jgi:hypothetical protein
MSAIHGILCNNLTEDSTDAFIIKGVSENTDSSMFIFAVRNQAKRTTVRIVMYTSKLEVKRYINRISISDFYAENF